MGKWIQCHGICTLCAHTWESEDSRGTVLQKTRLAAASKSLLKGNVLSPWPIWQDKSFYESYRPHVNTLVTVSAATLCWWAQQGEFALRGFTIFLLAWYWVTMKPRGNASTLYSYFLKYFKTWENNQGREPAAFCIFYLGERLFKANFNYFLKNKIII